MDNLATEVPWIPVAMSNGSHATLTLRDVLVQAHDIYAIYGQYPSQTAALTRFIAAAIMAIYRPWDDDTIAEITESGRLDQERIDEYINTWHDRFDLIGDPGIYQADFHNEFGPMSEIDNTRASGGNTLWWDHEPQETPYDAARAARALVTVQTNRYSGIRGAPLDVDGKYAEGTQGKIICPAGPIASTAVYLIVADNLLETIITNCPPGFSGSDDAPAWEQPPMAYEPNPDNTWNVPSRAPLGIMDWYTWQSRMVRLRRNPVGMYSGAAVSIGVLLDEPYTYGPYRVPDTMIWWTDRAGRITVSEPDGDDNSVTGVVKKEVARFVVGEVTATPTGTGIVEKIEYKKNRGKDVAVVHYGSSWSGRPTAAAVRLEDGAMPSAAIIAEMSRLDWSDPETSVRVRRYGQIAGMGKIKEHQTSVVEIRLVPEGNPEIDPEVPSVADPARQVWVDAYIRQFGPMSYTRGAARASMTPLPKGYQWQVDVVS